MESHTPSSDTKRIAEPWRCSGCQSGIQRLILHATGTNLHHWHALDRLQGASHLSLHQLGIIRGDGHPGRAGRGAERAAALGGVHAAGAGDGQRAAVCDGPGRLGAGAAAAAPGRGERPRRGQQPAGSQAAPPSLPPPPPACTCLQLVRWALTCNLLPCIAFLGARYLPLSWLRCRASRECLLSQSLSCLQVVRSPALTDDCNSWPFKPQRTTELAVSRMSIWESSAAFSCPAKGVAQLEGPFCGIPRSALMCQGEQTEVHMTLGM